MNDLRPIDWRYANCELFQIGLDELRQKRERAPLTAGQARIALLMGQGYSPTDVAARLGRSVNSVKNDLVRIYRRLGLTDPRIDQRVKLALYGSCELFQIGVQELGLLVA